MHLGAWRASGPRRPSLWPTFLLTKPSPASHEPTYVISFGLNSYKPLYYKADEVELNQPPASFSRGLKPAYKSPRKVTTIRRGAACTGKNEIKHERHLTLAALTRGARRHRALLTDADVAELFLVTFVADTAFRSGCCRWRREMKDKNSSLLSVLRTDEDRRPLIVVVVALRQWKGRGR